MSSRSFGSLNELYTELRRRVDNQPIHYKFGNPNGPTIMFINRFPSHFDAIPALTADVTLEEYEEICERKNRDLMFRRFGLFKRYFRDLFLGTGFTDGSWQVKSARWLDIAYETCACKTEEPKRDIPEIITERYQDLLSPEIELVNPEVIVTAGEDATQATANALLGQQAPKVDRMTDSKFWNPVLYDTTPMMIPTVHWAAQDNNPEYRDAYQESVRRARNQLEPFIINSD